MNVFDLFSQALGMRVKRDALISGVDAGRQAVTFGELDVRINAVVAQLSQRGLRTGDRVLVAVPVSIETYIIMLALLKAGMVIMFIDPAHSASCVAGILRSWPPAAVISTRVLLLLRYVFPELRQIPHKLAVDGPEDGESRLTFSDATACSLPPVPRSSADSALLTFTSGSTGEPKAVLRTHGFLRQQLRILNQVAGLANEDIDFVAMPMFGLFNLANGVTSIIPACDMKHPGRVDHHVVMQQLRMEHATRMIASPALLERLAERVDAGALPEMRLISTGGGPVSPLLGARLARIAPAAVVRIVYGSTEAEPIACIDAADVSLRSRDKMQRGGGLLVGKPIAGCEVRIIPSRPGQAVPPCNADEFASLCISLTHSEGIGEVVVSGEHVLTGYADAANNPANKIEVGGTIWHRTGDAGYFDELGRLWLVGRCSAAIEDSRGTVYPFQVEYAVNAVAGIRRSALVQHDGKRVLVLEATGRDFRSACVAAASCIANNHIDRIVTVRRIPLDKRHDAKIDYPALQRFLDGRFTRYRLLLFASLSKALRFASRCRRFFSRFIRRGRASIPISHQHK